MAVESIPNTANDRIRKVFSSIVRHPELRLGLGLLFEVAGTVGFEVGAGVDIAGVP
ncbi:hypothetical protein ABEW05_010741 [Botrytis cinerea]